MADNVKGVFEHYWSTACMHALHTDCRLNCKFCDAPCKCPCHLHPSRA